MTTESERAERIRRLQERRGAPSSLADTQPLDRAETDRADRIRRLRERRDAVTGFDGASRGGGTSPTAPRDRGSHPDRPRRGHKAEASRVFAMGAGVTLTFSLLALMTKADEVAAAQTIDVEPLTSTAQAYELSSPTSATSVTSLAPAMATADIPVILTPVQVRTHVVRLPSDGTSTVSRGTTGGSGGTPVATAGGGGGGGSVSAPPPPPPPPPPADTATNGSG